MAHTSEYEIEDIFIDRLEGIGYKFIKLNNYDEVLANFREQLAKFNAKKLEEKGHTASFSDSEFNRIMIHVDNHSVYESAKVLRDKYDLQLDNGESVYIEFFSGDTDRNIYQVTYNFIEGKLSAAVVGIRDGKNIDMPTFWEIELNVPSLPEQQKIAEFLSTVDRVIEKQKETITTWKERKKGVMQKLFSQEVRFKANDGSEFPEWEEKKIDDIATCFAGATPSTKIPEYWDNGTIQWMSSGEVNNGQIYETEKRISQLGFDKCSTKMVKPNTVVMALAGQGKTRGMVAITRVPLCTNQSLCAIETNDDICDDYLYQYLQTQYNNLRLISSGDGTRGGLNLKLVGGYVVSMPCFIEQQKIVACLSALDDVIEKKKATLAAWEELKKGLLQQMFV